MESKYSHSEIGSTYWFNTLVGAMMHIGEYLKTHSSSQWNENTITKWGGNIEDRCRELLEWRRTAPETSRETLIMKVEEILNKLKGGDDAVI